MPSDPSLIGIEETRRPVGGVYQQDEYATGYRRKLQRYRCSRRQGVMRGGGFCSIRVARETLARSSHDPSDKVCISRESERADLLSRRDRTRA
ncbi:hypothetical protein Tco_1257792 [Tanacetum coccineum]